MHLTHEPKHTVVASTTFSVTRRCCAGRGGHGAPGGSCHHGPGPAETVWPTRNKATHPFQLNADSRTVTQDTAGIERKVAAATKHRLDKLHTDIAGIMHEVDRCVMRSAGTACRGQQIMETCIQGNWRADAPQLCTASPVTLFCLPWSRLSCAMRRRIKRVKVPNVGREMVEMLQEMGMV